MRKEDILNVEDIGDISKVLYKLRPVMFQYRNHSSQSKSFGLLAEEVQKVAPELVIYDIYGKPELVKQYEFIYLLLNEIQNLHQSLENINLRVDELIKRVYILESK